MTAESIGEYRQSMPRRLARLPLRSFDFVRRWPVIPAIVLGALVISAIFAPQLAPHDPYFQSLRDRNTPPSWMAGGSTSYILGTDALGRDILSRIIYGARVSLLVAGIALASGLVLGTTLGLIAGWFGGVVDETISRLVDIWYAMPFLLLAFVVVILWGQSFGIMMVILAMVSWVAFVRNVRADVLMLKDRDYVALARICGASNFRLIFRHVLPGTTSTIMVVATLSVGSLILTEATLSFLGVGIPAPTAAWGLMVSEGRDFLSRAWWLSTFPGIAIFLVVMSLNFLGDWLRDRFDPKLRQL